jgi:hypothetical protein
MSSRQYIDFDALDVAFSVKMLDVAHILVRDVANIIASLIVNEVDDQYDEYSHNIFLQPPHPPPECH